MRRKTRTKVKKGILISGIIVGIVLIIIGIIFVIKLHQRPPISYDDGITCKNYFSKITINMETKEVKRDEIDSSLKEEFDITDEAENMAFNSKEEMKKLLSNSVFEITENDKILEIKNPYQTKSIIVKASEIKEKVAKEEIEEVADGLYILSFYSEKLTKAMYNYYKERDYVEKICNDEIFQNTPINDISQTMYGKTDVNLNNYHSLGVTLMGLDNYAKIINDNGNPKDIVIGTIGYGLDYQNEFISPRIDENYYNYILDNKNISETTKQGSRIAEVLVDSTTQNIKILPLVTVTEEGYTSITSILKSLKTAREKADVVCYELIHSENEVINYALEACFKENIPVCTVSSNYIYANQKEDEKNDYPANNGMTIAVASLDRELKITDYSGTGNYIDFSAPSTDVEEIFGNNPNISRWSGAQYSNAGITAIIALIKTYNKDATILEIYNFIRNFCEDLGTEGKDELYGYGCPKFNNLTIADIDKKAPEFKSIEYENETWELTKQTKIVASDNIRMNSWAITQNENGPDNEQWKEIQNVTPDLDVTWAINENGKYYIWIRDMAGNTSNKEIQIDKIDNTPPEISYTINKDTLGQGYVTINVTAIDNESGLYDSPFSWDKITWSKENGTRTIRENGRYKVYAEDNLGNISEAEILVDCFPQEGTYELQDGNIITYMNVPADWIGNTNNNVEIRLNGELNIIGWQITQNLDIPSEFVATNNIISIEENNMPNENAVNNITNSAVSNEMNNETNISLPNGVIWNYGNTNVVNEVANETTNDSTNEVIQPTIRVSTDPITIHVSLDIDKPYYLWIKDIYGNLSYQIFTIHKAVI